MRVPKRAVLYQSAGAEKSLIELAGVGEPKHHPIRVPVKWDLHLSTTDGVQVQLPRLTPLRDRLHDVWREARQAAEVIATAVACDIPVVLEVAGADAEGRELAGAASGNSQTPPDQAMLLDEEWRTISSPLCLVKLSTGTGCQFEVGVNTPCSIWGIYKGLLPLFVIKSVFPRPEPRCLVPACPV